MTSARDRDISPRREVASLPRGTSPPTRPTMLANPFDLLGLDADADESDSDEELVFAQGQHIRESMDDQTVGVASV